MFQKFNETFIKFQIIYLTFLYDIYVHGLLK